MDDTGEQEIIQAHQGTYRKKTVHARRAVDHRRLTVGFNESHEVIKFHADPDTQESKGNLDNQACGLKRWLPIAGRSGRRPDYFFI